MKYDLKYTKYLCLLGLLLCFGWSFGQHNYELNNRGALLRVDANADLYIWGDFHNSGSGATLNHDGFIEVQGHMISDNQVQQRGQGTVRLENNDVNVTDQQFIQGSYAVRGGTGQIGVDDGSFYNLELANTQGIVYLLGGGNVADVRNQVDFQPAGASGTPPLNRIITHDATAIPANGSGYASVFGMMNSTPGLGNFLNNTVTLNGNNSGVDAGYVQGNLRRAIAGTGGTYEYVVGLEPAGAAASRGVQYILLDFQGNNYDVVNSYFEQGSANTIGGTPGECGYQINYFAGIDHGEWMFTDINSTGSGNYEARIWPQDGTWPAATVWFVTKDNAIQGTPNDCGPTPTGLDRSAFNGFVGPSEFSFASGSTILDENDLLLSARPRDDRYIAISWTNTEERNIDTYALQRSLDDLNFVTITDRAASGNAGQQQQYLHDDFDVVPGQDYFYRVRLRDNAGAEFFSNSVLARLGLNGAFDDLQIFPNPVDADGLTIRVTASEDRSFDLSVYDAIGKRVHTGAYEAGIGVSEYTVATSEWSAGTYFLHLHTEGQSIIKEIVRKR